MRKLLNLLSIVALLTWGAVFLYFYVTGRVDRHLDPSFRIYTLLSGIGMLLLGSFNFLNRNRAVGVCDHVHAHGDPCDHDHSHEHDHDHSHDHDHEPHDHHHDHSGEDHDHASHEDHDHSEDGNHDHDHAEHDHGDHGHHHHEETNSGIAFSLLVLLVPLLFATGYSKDMFSQEYLTKWGKIERQMMQMRLAQSRASEPSLSSVDPSANPYTRDGIEGETPTDADTPPDRDGTSDDAGDSWATFTLEDLKQMVPQSDAGDFLLDVPQIFYTAGDRELMDVMEGIPVETTAQLMEETLHNPNGTRLKAFRLFIECCAADARPLSIPIDFGAAPPSYTEMGWYRIFGKLRYLDEDGDLFPVIEVKTVEETSEPTDGLLF